MILDKKILRNKYLKLRLEQNPLEIAQKNQIIGKKVLEMDVVSSQKRFLTYIAIRNEVDTTVIINGLIQRKALIAIPAFSNKSKSWLLSKLNNWDDLVDGPYNISQPKTINPVDPKEINVAILPGLAFSKNGVRLGYGKGVFDMLLSKSKAIKIGLAFDFQITDKLPKEEHDLVMDLVVSEKKIYRF